MQRFCWSHLLCICCAILTVLSYVLFDLLDIDGSNFDHPPNACTVEEEQLVCEDADRHVGPGHLTVWVPARDDRWTAIQSSPTSTSTGVRSFHLHNQSRAALSLQGTASTQPDSDPARPTTEP